MSLEEVMKEDSFGPVEVEVPLKPFEVFAIECTERLGVTVRVYPDPERGVMRICLDAAYGFELSTIVMKDLSK